MVEATVVRAPAGLGKTSLVLEAVASGDVDTVEVYAPTHALCEEQADKLREANPDITCKVIGGRGHLGTDGQPLCRKDDLASEVAAAGGDVSSALCHARGGKGESDRRCPHYDSCAYIAQFKPTQVTFYPHAYLGLERMRLEADPPRFAVIDESFFLAGVGKYSIPRSLLRAEFVGHCARTVLDAIDVALLNGLPLLQRLRSREILHAEIESAVKELRGGRPPISPDMTEAQQHAGLALLRQQTELINLLTAVRAELFTRRAASHALRYCGATDTVVVHTKARIRRFSHRPPQGERYDSKVLIIDASADKAIVRQFFEVTAFCDPQVMRQAEVIQCGSTRCSTTSITPERNGDLTSRKAAQERVRELEYLIQRLAERHPSVLVVGPQAITGNAKSGIPAAFSMPSNVELAHFNAIRGMDCWKEVDAIVVIGRNQPPLEEVGAIARSLFLTDDEPMQFAENWTTEV